MTTYIDSSVLLRIVLGEQDPLDMWPAVVPVSSELLRVECLRVIDRAHVTLGTSGEETARHRADILEALAAFRLVPVSAAVLERAADPFPTALGSLGAVHLASALEVRQLYPDLAVATHDPELAVAARSVGFAVTGA